MTLQHEQNYINQDGDAITLVPEDPAPAAEQEIVLHGAGGRLYTVDMTGVTAAIIIRLPRVSEAGLNAEITIVGKGDRQVTGSLTVETQPSPPALPPQDILGSNPDPYIIAASGDTVTFSNDAKTTWFITARTQ